MILDLKVWKEFLITQNGSVTMLPVQWEDNETLNLFTDSAGSIGFGVYFDGRWAQGTWPVDLVVPKSHIAFLELFPVVLAVLLWANILQNRKIMFHCDNQSVVAMIQKQSTPDQHCMRLIRIFVLHCLKFNILFRAKYIPGEKNEIADALSRFQMIRFQYMCPQAEQHMTVIPESVWRLLRQKPEG
jgi:hypothetical protein